MTAEEYNILLDNAQKLFPGQTPEELPFSENSKALAYGQTIVRIPKKDSTLQGYKREETITHYIKEHAPDLNIPVVNIINGISVHKEISGKTLNDRTQENHRNKHSSSLSKNELNLLAQDLGKFLAQLHQVPIDGIDPHILNMTHFNNNKKSKEYADNNGARLLKNQGIRYRKLNIDENDIVLSHNDMHGGNFVINEENKLAGVFDFGELGINYRHSDFMKLIPYGRNFIKQAVQSYNKYSDKKISMKTIDRAYQIEQLEFLQLAEKKKLQATDEQAKTIENRDTNFNIEKELKTAETINNYAISNLKKYRQQIAQDYQTQRILSSSKRRLATRKPQQHQTQQPKLNLQQFRLLRETQHQ
ncbi:MAG: aminoglycoside phosphotransferase family protein [Alphaproteobacteria bacterium]|nr:aminoglycoside phosphotransferase family protein [Alphaproteobacteria bacterium]